MFTANRLGFVMSIKNIDLQTWFTTARVNVSVPKAVIDVWGFCGVHYNNLPKKRELWLFTIQAEDPRNDRKFSCFTVLEPLCVMAGLRAVHGAEC